MSPAVPPLATVTARSVRLSRVKSKQISSSALAGVTSSGVSPRPAMCGFTCRIAVFAAAREHEAAGAAEAVAAATAAATIAMGTKRRKGGSLDAEPGLPLGAAQAGEARPDRGVRSPRRGLAAGQRRHEVVALERERGNRRPRR